jgi:hypothetical protein
LRYNENIPSRLKTHANRFQLGLGGREALLFFYNVVTVNILINYTDTYYLFGVS